MLRSPVPLLFLIAIFVVNPAKALPNETISSPEVQLQQVPGSTSSVPNDTVAWTTFSSFLTIAGAIIVLLLTALCVESEEKPELYRRLRYPLILGLGYFGIFVLFGVVDRQSIWSTVGGSAILCLIVLLAVQTFWSSEVLLLPKLKAIFYLHGFFGYVALSCVGIASHLGAACLNGCNWFIFGGAFVCFVGMLGILVHEPSASYNSSPKIVVLYGYVLIVYIGILGNLSLVGFDGKFAVLKRPVTASTSYVMTPLKNGVIGVIGVSVSVTG
uniref:Cytochrome b561 domain-containing protein n=1 Tax=Globodera pallida TaxID=36090 RepID=A0A183CF23_GLOPA